VSLVLQYKFIASEVKLFQLILVLFFSIYCIAKIHKAFYCANTRVMWH